MKIPSLPDLKTLVVWDGAFDRYPAPILSSDQYTIYRSGVSKNLPPKSINFEDEVYALPKLAEKLCSINSFQLVVVFSGATGRNKPTGIEAFSCTKVLVLLDSHHMELRPIRRLKDYTQEQKFDAVIALYNRGHLKWFSDIPRLKRGWFPGITIEHIAKPIQPDRKRQIIFVGNWSKLHHHRKRMLDRISQSDLPLQVVRALRAESANYFSSSTISFNCSLNGDMNMRNFEILSAGGFLMTDKLAPENGLDTALRAGYDYVNYTDFEDFETKANYFLANPEAALDIARNGHATYLSKFHPNIVANEIINWCMDDQPSHHSTDYSLLPINHFSADLRLQIYEFAQVLQQSLEVVEILAVGADSTRLLPDFLGLCRRRLCFRRLNTIASPHPDFEPVDNVRNTTWHIVVADAHLVPALEQAGVQYRKLFVSEAA